MALQYKRISISYAYCCSSIVYMRRESNDQLQHSTVDLEKNTGTLRDRHHRKAIPSMQLPVIAIHSPVFHFLGQWLSAQTYTHGNNTTHSIDISDILQQTLKKHLFK